MELILEKKEDPKGSYWILRKVCGEYLCWDGDEADEGSPIARFPSQADAESFADFYDHVIRN